MNLFRCTAYTEMVQSVTSATGFAKSRTASWPMLSVTLFTQIKILTKLITLAFTIITFTFIINIIIKIALPVINIRILSSV